MSNFFLKSDLNGFFDTTTESNISLPQWVSVVDNANQTVNRDETSATSSFMPGQLGGGFSATSATNVSDKDVNKLISMLTSESSSNGNVMSETSTNTLEQQLREILNTQNGGSKNARSKKMNGGGMTTVEDIKKFFYDLKSQGVNVNVKLDNKSMTEFFGGAIDTTTDVPAPKAASAPKINLSETSDFSIESIINKSQAGGAKKRSKKASKKSSRKSSKKSSKKLSGGKGMNPGFKAFLDLRTHIAKKLGIKNGPPAAIVASAVQKEVKEKRPELDSNKVKLAEEARKHFDSNVEHFRQMLP